MQGLQFRWYRIREEKGLEPLRRGESGEKDAEAWKKMEHDGGLEPKFLSMIRQI